MTLVPRIVVVTRRTPYEELLARHATRRQAEFFLTRRGQTLDALEREHARVRAALDRVNATIPLAWRRNLVLREELDRFLFEPSDTVVVVGQDGLVANVAKYLDGQPVLGVNPTPDLVDGVLVRYAPDVACRVLRKAALGEAPIQERTMVEARLDDGSTICALNELFLGARTHQSARYEIAWNERKANHSSSGIIVTTGTGSTGWARSIHLARRSRLALPQATDRSLAFFVREAFPSLATSTDLAEGSIAEGSTMVVTSRMEEGVIFGDGIESDRLRFEWGTKAEVKVAEKRLRLVI